MFFILVFKFLSIFNCNLLCCWCDDILRDDGDDYRRRGDDARWAGFNLKLDERVEISMYKMRMLNSSHPSWRAPASLRLFEAESFDSRGPWRSPMDKVHADVATAKISKSDQWRQVERGASRTTLVAASPHAGHSSRVHFEVRAPKGQITFSRRSPGLETLTERP